MAIEKRIFSSMKVASSFHMEGRELKIASFDPPKFVPPEVTDFISNAKHDPRYALLHIIAMSDGGMYGSNLNGDIFRSDELRGMQDSAEAAKNPGDMRGICVPRYKTFEQSKFFHHHDNGPDSPSYGDVPLAAFSLPMLRVELIIRIRRDLDPASAQMADNNDTLSTSMGCRIHHEKCIYCGHENELTSDRCDHLKYHMNEIMPDGRLVAADNFKPRFFDISKVTIPADPIALSLGKVASAPQTIILPDHWNMRNTARDCSPVTKAAWRQKWSEIAKEVPMTGTVENLSPDDVPVAPTEACGDGCTAGSGFAPEELQLMLQLADGNIEKVVSTLAAAGVVLSPVELTSLVATATPEVPAQADEYGEKPAAEHAEQAPKAPEKGPETDSEPADGDDESPAAAEKSEEKAEDDDSDSDDSEKDAALVVPLAIRLDSFCEPLYHAFHQKIAARSGFRVAPSLVDWSPAKLAEHPVVSDLYAYYRCLLGSLPLADFEKHAQHNPAIRRLAGEHHGVVDDNRVKAAQYFLAFTGLPTAYGR